METNFEETRSSIDLISEKVCIHCQDYESNVGHTAERCPKTVCENCNKNGHIKVHCMSRMEDLPFPNEILFKILSYLSIQELKKCEQVSKRIREISRLAQKRKRRR